VPVNASLSDIRKAFLAKARESHPDRHKGGTALDDSDFDTVHKAYEHLTLEGGNGTQCNPAHSLNLMLELNRTTLDGSGTLELNEGDDDYFKARLIAVLLEYSDKGLDLCNVKKKWTQVWPKVPFPHETEANGRKRRGGLLDFIRLKAGDVVDVVIPPDGKGSIRVIPKNCTQSQVARFALERQGDSAHER